MSPLETVQSLWIGDTLSTMEILCIESFLAHGHSFHLYTYDHVENVPDGTVIKDASEIIPSDMIFKYKDHDSYAGFSNLFRYKLLYEKGGYWVDTDIVCLKPFLAHDEYIFASERLQTSHQNDTNQANCCLMKVPAKSDIMKYCYETALAKDNSKLVWGTTGPKLLAQAIEKFTLLKYLAKSEDYCPIAWWNWDQVIQPAGSKNILSNSNTLHLWNEMWRRAKTNKDSSFTSNSLYELLKTKYLTKTLLLEPKITEHIDNTYLRQCTLKKMNGEVCIDEQVLWYKFSDRIEAPAYNDCDSFLLNIILDAMKEERKIIINGSVSTSLLSNLIEYQSAWNQCCPETYKVVDMVVDTIRKDKVAKEGSVCTFSGGLDSTHTIWRHSQKKCSYRTQKINFASIVHGFDIPLNQDHIFMNAYNTAKNTLKDINVALESIQTNYKEISSLDWNHSHGAALVATLSNFKHMAGNCILASTNEYNHIRLAVGSNPIVDHLLGSSEFAVMHDGASHTRIEKAKEVSDWEHGTANLRVCWEGVSLDRNCGKCEKCLRTQINFLINNEQIPKSFPHPEKIEENLQNFILKKGNIPPHEWENMLEYIQHHKIQETWVTYVTQIVHYNNIKLGSQNPKILFDKWEDIIHYLKKNNIQGECVDNIKKIINKDMIILKNDHPSNIKFLHKIIIYAKKTPIVNLLLPVGSKRRMKIVKLLNKRKHIN